MDQPMIGALPDGRGNVRFRVFAPNRERVEVVFPDHPDRLAGLEDEGRGYFSGLVSGLGAGARYLYRLDHGEILPDPASRLQPEGAAGPSEVVDPDGFDWEDEHPPSLDPAEMVVYELHVGTFTPEGTLDAAIPRLAELQDLGIDAVEIMPVAAFPGRRNWGYDGVFPFAVHAEYGGPEALRRLVKAAHRLGLGVILDVVYNHLGPEGAVHHAYGPYQAGRAATPWGRSMNFDGLHGHGVRRYFIDNALHWLREHRLDGLRLDAVQEIHDGSARHFLSELSRETRILSDSTGRDYALIAESGRNDPRMVSPRRLGGHGLDAMWAFDFHHALHALLTGERNGYYADFGRAEDLALALEQGFVLTGQYSAFHETIWGAPPVRPDGVPLASSRFVRYAQSHDEVGNRPWGRRLSRLADFEGLKLAAAAALLAPGPAMLFMGEEYGESRPFHFFADFENPRLNAAVQRGRRREMRELGHTGRSRNPAGEQAFRESVLDWETRRHNRHAVLWNFHKELIAWRRKLSKMGVSASRGCRASARGNVVAMARPGDGEPEAVVLMNFNAGPVRPGADAIHGGFGREDGLHLVLDSASCQWAGPGDKAMETLGPAAWLVLPGRSARLYVRNPG